MKQNLQDSYKTFFSFWNTNELPECFRPGKNPSGIENLVLKTKSKIIWPRWHLPEDISSNTLYKWLV